MKKLAIILLLFSSCINTNPKLKKPFTITQKFVQYTEDKNVCQYYYQDANGFLNSFREFNNSYNIGDTIK